MWILLKQETVGGSDISWTICKSAPHPRQIPAPAPHHSVFQGRMPFLPPNQQHQSTEGNALCKCSVLIMIIIMLIVPMTMFTVLSSCRGHCESSPGSFVECRLSARWTSTLKPSQPTWLESLPVGCYHPHPTSPFITITQSES